LKARENWVGGIGIGVVWGYVKVLVVFGSADITNTPAVIVDVPQQTCVDVPRSTHVSHPSVMVTSPPAGYHFITTH